MYNEFHNFFFLKNTSLHDSVCCGIDIWIFSNPAAAQYQGTSYWYLHNFFLCLGLLSFSLMFYWHLGCSRPNAQVKYLTLADWTDCRWDEVLSFAITIHHNVDRASLFKSSVLSSPIQLYLKGPTFKRIKIKWNGAGYRAAHFEEERGVLLYIYIYFFLNFEKGFGCRCFLILAGESSKMIFLHFCEKVGGQNEQFYGFYYAL